MKNVGLVALACLVASSSAWSQGAADRSSLDQLLSDGRNQVSLLKNDVGTLDLFVRSGIGSQPRSSLLDVYTERVSALRSQAARLVAMRSGASHWQQVAVDQIAPLMQEFASNAECAIDAFRKIQDPSSAAGLLEYEKLSSDLADELSKLIGAWVDYSRTRGELDRVAEKIGAPVPLSPKPPARPNAGSEDR